MRKVKKILHVFFVFIMLSLLTFIVAMELYPEKTSKIVGFRFYTVLTNSMEPTIPTFSLVMTHVIPETDDIKPNTIVTFRADRFGEDVLVTHYFRHTQEKDGITYYRTQPEGKDINNPTEYDNYETIREDIIGTYMFHIPYLGKIFLFLKSPFGYLMYAELLVIYLVNKLVKAKWEEKEHENTAKNKEQRDKVEIMAISFQKYDGYSILRGQVRNNRNKTVRFVSAKLELEFEDLRKAEEKWYLVNQKGLPPREVSDFEYTILEDQEIKAYQLIITSFKESK